MQVVLLERVEKLGQMGEVVSVKDGYARNYLLPQGKALRSTKANLARFERERVQLEARNLELKKDAEGVAAKLDGQQFVIIRQASEAGSLYGSVAARDVAEAATEAGFKVERRQIVAGPPGQGTGPARDPHRPPPRGRRHHHGQRRAQPRGGRAPGQRPDDPGPPRRGGGRGRVRHRRAVRGHGLRRPPTTWPKARRRSSRPTTARTRAAEAERLDRARTGPVQSPSPSPSPFRSCGPSGTWPRR